jgi:hypothetical protein
MVTVITIQCFLKWWQSPPLTCPGDNRHHNPLFGGWWWLPISIFPLVVSVTTHHHSHHAPPYTTMHHHAPPPTMKGDHFPHNTLCGIRQAPPRMGLTDFDDTLFFGGPPLWWSSEPQILTLSRLLAHSQLVTPTGCCGECKERAPYSRNALVSG